MSLTTCTLKEFTQKAVAHDASSFGGNSFTVHFLKNKRHHWEYKGKH